MKKIKNVIFLNLSIILMILLFNINVSNATSSVSISRTNVEKISDQTYTGIEIKPSVKVVYDGKTLSNGNDYTITYSNNIKAGTARIYITGIGNFTSKKTVNFKIQRKSVNSLNISNVSSWEYTGSYIKPEVTVKDQNKILVKGTDYSLTYLDNKDAGIAKIKIIGRGNYTGTIEKTFSITSKPISLSNVKIGNISSQEYTGKEILPKVSVKFNSRTLSLNKDYTVSGFNNINMGTATLRITGIGNYNGTISKEFKITSKNISKVKIDKIESQEYTGDRIRPTIDAYNGDVKLVSNTDYTISYTNNRKVGIATITLKGNGNYTGTKKVNFYITKIELEDSGKISDISNRYYTGSYIKPTVVVKYDGDRLTEGEDYTVSYSDNKNVGTATVTVRGKGNYTGTLTENFRILRSTSYDYDEDANIAISKTTVSSIVNQQYTGKTITPTVYVRYNGNLLTKNRDYTVSYSNNKNIGTAKIKITGKGNYTGTKTVTFKIVNNNSNSNNYYMGNIAISKTTVSNIINQKYTGYEIRPSVYIRYNGNLLQEGKDYTISYSNNVNVGYARITIIGTGNYTGTKTINFKIVR